MKRQLAAVFALLALMASMAGCSVMRHARSAVSHAIANPRPSDTSTAPSTVCGKPVNDRYLGYSVAGFPPDISHLQAVERATGVHANIASYYLPFGARLDMTALAAMCSEGIMPLVVMDTHTLAQFRGVMNGTEDSILGRYARDLSALQVPVAVDFNHEFNGSWYKWGYKYVNAAEFVKTWRHIVTIFRKNEATNVVWIWNPNVDLGQTVKSLRPWYPGDSFVSWVGLNGYFFRRTNTYASVFHATIHQIRAFATRPVLIVETGANPASGRARAIQSLFAGAAATPNLLGLIWFDYSKTALHDWRIDRDRSALAAFRASAQNYLKGGVRP